MLFHWAKLTAVLLTTLTLSFIILTNALEAREAASQRLTDSESRIVCTAKCLKTFKSKIVGQLAARIARNPEAINRECGGAVEADSQNGTDTRGLLNRIAVTECQACTFVCLHYLSIAGKYSSHRNCLTFCAVVERDEGFETRTCRNSCETLDRIFSGEAVFREPPVPPPPPRIDRILTGQPASPAGKPPSAVSAVLDWSSGYTALSSISPNGDPLVFLVQVSLVSSNIHPTWSSLAFTTVPRIRLDDLSINNRYLFRVGAVLPSGGIAYSAVSDELHPLSMMLDQARATTPTPAATEYELATDRRAIRHLREGSSSLGQCGSGAPREYCVAVLVQWQLARWVERRFRLVEYEISWSELETMGATVARQLLPPTRTDFTVSNLKPQATYRITVTANLILGDSNAKQQIIKSHSSITVKTMHVPNSLIGNRSQAELAAQQYDLLEQQKFDNECSCNKKPKTNLVTKEPYYENGELKMLLLWSNSVFIAGGTSEELIVNRYSIRWSQRVCIEADIVQNETRQTVVTNTLMLTVTGLRFNCHYSLQFSGLTNAGRVAFIWNSCFCTGSCKEVQIRGDRLPPCPASEVAQRPQPPDQLNVLVTGSVAHLSWPAPSYPPLRAIRGFRIRWGPREPEEVHPDVYSAGGLMPRLSNSRALTSLVGAGKRRFLLYALQPDTVYIASVQTLSAFGDSQPILKLFNTWTEAYSPTSRRAEEASKAENELVQKYITGVSAASCRGQILMVLLKATLLIFLSTNLDLLFG